MSENFGFPKGVPAEGDFDSMSDEDLDAYLYDARTRRANLERGGQIDSPMYHALNRGVGAMSKEVYDRKRAQNTPQPL